jgi:uncharacterized membrane protein YoaK (UPF0700 family)
MARLSPDRRHGPLPALLLGLTVFSGVVDAVSILGLGRVFVANMTGNVVFVGFAVAGALGISLAATLIALAGFLAGACTGGRLVGRLRADRARLIAVAATAELVLVTVATILVAAAHRPLSAGPRDIAVALLAAACGIQNGAVRGLGVPDLTTTVLTLTLTGIAADGHTPAFPTRVAAVVTMLVGATAGAELEVHVGITAALVLAEAILVAVTTLAWNTTRRPGAWRAPAGH